MSTERDELAQVFAGHQISFGAFPKRLMTGHAQEIADKILAAGYRKPQQVTTVEELDALPEGAVVEERGGAKFCQVTAAIWMCFDASTAYTSADIALPATVLHVGGADPAPPRLDSTLNPDHPDGKWEEL